MKDHKILLVEDEPFLGKVIKESLEKSGYTVQLAKDGKQGWELFNNNEFSLCILDVMLPYTDGFTLGEKIRKADVNIPFMFLTARSGIEDLKKGYSSGANDYLRKPFSLDELFLRIGELLKRNDSTIPQIREVLVGKYIFFIDRQELKDTESNIIKLSYKECLLLELLLKHKDRFLDRKEALLKIWGDDNYFNTRNMDVYVTKLRNKLKNDSSVEIVNIRGFGYKLIF